MTPDISKYLTQEIMTASPAKLVSMLYDKVRLSLKEAIAAIDAGEVEARWRANARAMEILSHMWSTLDVEKGGEIAQNLESLFSFMLSRLPEVDFRNDPEPAREVIELLEPVRDRLEIQRQNLLQRYIAMETAIASANSIMDSLRQTTDQLGKSNN